MSTPAVSPIIARLVKDGNVLFLPVQAQRTCPLPIDEIPKKDIFVVQRDWNAKVGKDACENWQGICGPFCNDDTKERRLRLLEFATFNDLVLANTFGHHKASRRCHMA